MTNNDDGRTGSRTFLLGLGARNDATSYTALAATFRFGVGSFFSSSTAVAVAAKKFHYPAAAARVHYRT